MYVRLRAQALFPTSRDYLNPKSSGRGNALCKQGPVGPSRLQTSTSSRAVPVQRQVVPSADSAEHPMIDSGGPTNKANPSFRHMHRCEQRAVLQERWVPDGQCLIPRPLVSCQSHAVVAECRRRSGACRWSNRHLQIPTPRSFLVCEELSSSTNSSLAEYITPQEGSLTCRTLSTARCV